VGRPCQCHNVTKQPHVFIFWNKRSAVDPDDLYHFYTTVIRPILEYACPVWHSSLAVEHSNRIEAIQKRAFRIIFGSFDYLDFCTRNGLSTLYERRDLLARQFFQSILNKNSCLNYLLPEERSDRVIGKLRHPSIFKLPHVHTTRSKTSFINYALDHYIWFYLAVICNLLYFVLCVCLFYFLFLIQPSGCNYL